MKKIILFLISSAFIFSNSSCGNNKISSLSQAFELSEKAINNTYSLNKDFYNKGFLAFQVDSSFDDKIEKSKIESTFKINLNQKEINLEDNKFYGIEFELDSNDGKDTSKYQLLDNNLYYDFNNEKKYFIDLSNYLEDDSGISHVESELLDLINQFIKNLEKNNYDFQIFSWLNNKITTDQFYDSLMKNLNSLLDYNFDISKVFTNKDRKLFISTLDVIKENINLFISYRGDKSNITFYLESENFNKIKSAIYVNADESLRKILSSSQSTSYSDYAENFYEYIKKYISDDCFTYREICFTLGIKKNLVKSISFEVNFFTESKTIDYDLNMDFDYFSKPIIIEPSDASGEHEKIEISY